MYFNCCNNGCNPCNCFNSCNCFPQQDTSARSGNFNFPCDGSRRPLFISSTALNPFSLSLTNNSASTMIVELIRLNGTTSSSSNYTVSPGATSTHADTNVINVYVTGVPQNISTCSGFYTSGNSCYSCYNNYSCCNNYAGCSGSYSITTTAIP